MDKVIYKFLDNYYGDEFYVKKVKNMRRPEYIIYSPKGGPILSFMIFDDPIEVGKDERISIMGRGDVHDELSKFFGIDIKDARNYVRNWFGDKHNLKKVSDIKKFIPKNGKNNI